MNFSLTANVKYTVEQRLYETHTAYGLALIHSTCSSNRQFALKVTHATAPSTQPCFKNVIFRHHYVMHKNSRFATTEQHNVLTQRYRCRVLQLNRQNAMLITDKRILLYRVQLMALVWKYPTER